MLGVLANGKRALFESRHSAASHLLDVEGHCEVGADEKDVLRFQVSVSQFVVVQNWKVEKKKKLLSNLASHQCRDAPVASLDEVN